MAESPVASITTNVTRWPLRYSRNANTWLVIADHVVTVDFVPALPPPAIRTQTLASPLETSRPAHRGCISPITAPFSPSPPW